MSSLLLLLLTPAIADDGEDIVRKLAAQSAGYQDMVAEIEMVLTSNKGKESRRELQLSMLERPAEEEGDLSLLIFGAPADVSGTTLLSHPGAGKSDTDQQWLYLPALKRSQRIAGGGKAGSFAGSEFAYEDITGAEVGKHTWTLLDTEPCGQSTCHKLKTEPTYSGSGYDHRLVWVDADTLLPQTIEFYDKKGRHAKTLTYSGYQEYDGGHWRATTWAMVNHQSGRGTTLQFKDMTFGSGLGEADFSPDVLK